jgi:sugar O-acyltransferase (sialic acid O-acetyltransferase NeuD family)
MRELIVVGGGEHSCVVIEAASSEPSRWQILGVVDPSAHAEAVSRLNVPYLGDDDALRSYPDAALILGLGSRPLDHRRQDIVKRIDVTSERWAVVVHRAAWISPTAELAPGAVVFAGAIVNSGARLGRHCIINSHACIEHNAALGDFVHAAPGSIVAGGATIGDHSYLGLGSLVRDHRKIGRACLVGMGAVVTTNFADGMTLVGVPARPKPGDR